MYLLHLFVFFLYFPYLIFGTPVHYSCLENPMDGGAWKAAVHEVAKSRTRLSDFTFTFHFHALEKEMATHSSVLAWRIPGTGEPSGLPSMWSHRVGHDWSDLPSLPFTISQSLLKFRSIKLGMPSNHLILSSPCPPALSLSQHQGLFQWICSSHQMRGTGGTELQHQSLQWIIRVNFL